MNIKIFTLNPFRENTYLLYDETRECVIIDAGCYGKSEEKEINDFIDKNKLSPVKLINTHGHIDHILGLNYLKKTYNISFEANIGDEYLYKNSKEHGFLFGLDTENAPAIDKYLNDKDVIKFGDSELNVIAVPGHSPGHLAFYAKSIKSLFSGDTLFRESIGRTDLPGGDLDIILNSIKTKLLTLDDDVKVYPGHGPDTTIGYEKLSNPFL
jgi:hydroxyacylglutathione hydrolase